MLIILVLISIVGNFVAGNLERLFESVNPHVEGWAADLAWNGGMVGLYASLGVAFGFLLPFYLILSFLENSGYLPRVAFLMDRPCHAIGLHGKASIPLIVGFGCNVPACIGCRIIETKRDRLLATILSTLIPCSARTVVILGIVGTYMGPLWAVSLYIIDFLLIIAVGKAMSVVMKGRSPGLIMEMPPFRRPVPRLVARQAWARFVPFLKEAVPFIVFGSMVIEALRIVHMLDEIYWFISPLTVMWLGLPAFTGALFILGIMRKEAAVALLGVVAGTVDVASVMSPVQMFVFTLVMMLYIPCLATITVLGKEIGWKNTALITMGEIGLALFVGGITFRLLDLVM
jgi:ferrous iron transport protein B